MLGDRSRGAGYCTDNCCLSARAGEVVPFRLTSVHDPLGVHVFQGTAHLHKVAPIGGKKTGSSAIFGWIIVQLQFLATQKVSVKRASSQQQNIDIIGLLLTK